MDTNPQEAAQWHQARRRRRRRGCAALVLTPVLVITVMLGWFGFGLLDQPKVTRNYTAEWNAVISAVPEADRAWPLYKQAMIFKIGHPMPESTLLNAPIHPGWEHWDEYKAWLDEIAPALALIREGAAKPVLGRLYSSVPDEDIARANAAQDGTEYVPEEPEENPNLIEILLPELGIMRGFARDLSSDSFYAMEQGDTERAIGDIEASLGLAAHSAASKTVIGQLVQIAIEQLTSQTALRLIDEYPDGFSAENLARLQQAFMTIGRDGPPAAGGITRMALDISLERAMFYDFVQRTYSDDGHGNGHMTLEGVRMLDMITAMSGDDSVGEALPILVLSASRKELLEKYNGLMDRFEASAALAPWERETGWGLDAEIVAIQDNPISRARFMLISLLMPALNKAVITVDQANARRDATITAIALHRWRAEHGSFPSTLAAMVPGLIPSLPLDPADGKPLRYTVTLDGPVLYSLGADKDDDGGTRAEDERKSMAGQSDTTDGDWILYPVLPAEEPVDE